LKLNGLFKKNKYITLKEENTVKGTRTIPNIPDGMWVKCPKCSCTIYKEDLEKNLSVCKSCGHHFRIGALSRVDQIADQGSFMEIDRDMKSKNPLEFPGYDEKINSLVEKTGINDAVVTGICKINGNPSVLAVMDSNFVMGSMGSVVGEKITRAIEAAIYKKLPIIIFTASGGARMQEGMLSLLQMAKTTSALSKLNQAGNLYVSVITDPTTGGVSASFAQVADIVLSEPDAIIGFAGRRVVEQTIKQKLPDEFQKSEFALEKGFIDKIVKRDNLKETLSDILSLHKRTEV
jgi:acetyl-CoA carboxylase carboxyl transferase beta subunit